LTDKHKNAIEGMGEVLEAAGDEKAAETIKKLIVQIFLQGLFAETITKK
jgi:hypothetical protein